MLMVAPWFNRCDESRTEAEIDTSPKIEKNRLRRVCTKMEEATTRVRKFRNALIPCNLYYFPWKITPLIKSLYIAQYNDMGRIQKRRA